MIINLYKNLNIKELIKANYLKIIEYFLWSLWIAITIFKLINIVNVSNFLNTYKFFSPDSYDWISNGIHLFSEKYITVRNPGLPLIIKFLWSLNLMFLLPYINHIFLGLLFYYISKILNILNVSKVSKIVCMSILFFNYYLNDYANYILTDVYCIALISMSLFVLLKKNWYFAFFILGIGSLFQNFPLFLAPFWYLYWFIDQEKWKFINSDILAILKKSVLFVLVTLIPVLPWFIYKFIIWGNPLYTKVAQFSLLKLHYNTVIYYAIAILKVFSVPLIGLLLINTLSDIRNAILRKFKNVRKQYFFYLGSFFVLFFWVFLYDWSEVRFLFYLIPFIIPLFSFSIDSLKENMKIALIILLPILLFPVYIRSELFSMWYQFPITNDDHIQFTPRSYEYPVGKVSVVFPASLDWDGVDSLSEIKPYFYYYFDNQEYYMYKPNQFYIYSEYLKRNSRKDRLIVCDTIVDTSILNYVVQINQNRDFSSYQINNLCR
ncbi:hypothetical protein JW887_00175 [Candidatus Dojkabacteria bacterium]|nr:hypothetical protein [Candidatus Dojkabacteria bacterium]